MAAVFEDHVLLERNGVRESLYFSETRDSGIQVAAARQPAVTPEKFLRQAQAELRKNPRQALASVGLAPNENGEGYVYQGNNPMLNAMNMQKGDVIRSVNGYVLGNIEEDQALLQQLYEQGNLQVEIERGGTTFTINYALR
ncbi:hypothetical protein AAIA72_03620 [Hahella sp. SMD15-11]|uniref:General secretion pathway protein C n=1 Tax=Thermohahella caldifontis TaxID=3142973 RepID=A0AB39UZ99_9GAMM